jgi:hypothetical protein
VAGMDRRKNHRELTPGRLSKCDNPSWRRVVLRVAEVHPEVPLHRTAVATMATVVVIRSRRVAAGTTVRRAHLISQARDAGAET